MKMQIFLIVMYIMALFILILQIFIFPEFSTCHGLNFLNQGATACESTTTSKQRVSSY